MLDLLLISPLAWFAWRGFRRGIIAEGLSFITVVVGIVVAFRFMGWGMALARGHVASSTLPFAGFVLVFMLVLLGMYLLTKAAEGMLKKMRLGILNQLAGAGLGLFKAGFLISSLLWVVGYAHIIAPEVEKGSLFLAPIKAIAPATVAVGTLYAPAFQHFYKDLGTAFPGDSTRLKLPPLHVPHLPLPLERQRPAPALPKASPKPKPAPADTSSAMPKAKPAHPPKQGKAKQAKPPHEK